MIIDLDLLALALLNRLVNLQEHTYPDKLEFFARLDGDGYLLQKTRKEITITYVPQAQRTFSSLAGGGKSTVVTITENDFQELWDKIKVLDFQRYQHIQQQDMAPICSQPGESISPFILIKINGKKVVDKDLFFPGPEMILISVLAEPLIEINNLLAEKFRNNQIDQR